MGSEQEIGNVFFVVVADQACESYLLSERCTLLDLIYHLSVGLNVCLTQMPAATTVGFKFSLN